MSKFIADYRVHGRTFSLDIIAGSWQEAEFRLEALKDNGGFYKRDIITYRLEDGLHDARCRYFETEDEAMEHLRFIKGNATITGKLAMRVPIPSIFAPKID